MMAGGFFFKQPISCEVFRAMKAGIRKKKKKTAALCQRELVSFIFIALLSPRDNVHNTRREVNIPSDFRSAALKNVLSG